MFLSAFIAFGSTSTEANPNFDTDGDGSTNFEEAHVGTNPFERCSGTTAHDTTFASNSWALNIFANAGSPSANDIDIQDIVSFTTPIRRLDTVPTSPNYDVRWDVEPGPGGPFVNHINIADLTKVSNATVPMFGGIRGFNGPPCPGDIPDGNVNYLYKLNDLDAYLDPNCGASCAAHWANVNTKYESTLLFSTHADQWDEYTGRGFFYRDTGISTNHDAGQPTQIDEGEDFTNSEILRDMSGNPCYWLAPGTGAQHRFAPDVGATTYDDIMVATILARANFPQYDGIYFDDVNPNLGKVICDPDGVVGGTGYCGGNCAVRNPRTGNLYTQAEYQADWQTTLTNVRAGISAAKPFLFNVQWYDATHDQGKGTPNQTVIDNILSIADFSEIEHGFLDGSGQHYQSIRNWIERLHTLNVNFLLQGHPNKVDSDQDRDYEVGWYLLLSNGSDMYAGKWEGGPEESPFFYDLNLGEATSGIYTCGTLTFCRDFAGTGGGPVTVSVNANTKTMALIT